MSKPTTIRQLMKKWNTNLSNTLKSCFPCRNDTIVPRLLRYETLIKPAFVPWMSKTWEGCQSSVARAACADNLLCEIGDDHPAMLTRYVDQADPNPNRYGTFVNAGRLRSNQDRLEELIVPDHPLSGLVVMMLLENTSLIFIPELRRWGKVLGFRDFEYVDKHGRADIDHANEFRAALVAETKRLGFDLKHMASHYREEVSLVTSMLLAIFKEPIFQRRKKQ